LAIKQNKTDFRLRHEITAIAKFYYWQIYRGDHKSQYNSRADRDLIMKMEFCYAISSKKE